MARFHVVLRTDTGNIHECELAAENALVAAHTAHQHSDATAHLTDVHVRCLDHEQ